MSQEVKLIVAEEHNGTKHEFMIYTNQIVGEGGFGVVKKAIETSNPQKPLVVKIIPYMDEKKRQKIQKQLNIIRTLPQNQNLVNVRPLKCFSTKNYYIFMEYCKDGTLEDQLKKGRSFTEQEVLDFFWQFMRGYRVLWERKILHQDIKPDNVLIKKSTYKITDFGFSIFHEGHKYSNIREGTLPYMPLEKLTEKEYYATTKIDVYALGVILFKMIIGHHPWVRSKAKDYKQFLKELNINKLALKPDAHHAFSMKFQHFFDLVIRMIAKKEENRVDFNELFQYLETEQIFDKMRKKQKEQSEVIIIGENQRIIITDQSAVIAIPFGVGAGQEKAIIEKSEQNNLEKKRLEDQATIKKLDNYVACHRIIVYFFDRLARRIYVQKLKKKQIFCEEEQKVRLGLLLLCRKIVQNLLRQSKMPVIFKLEEWKVYRRMQNNFMKLIQRDESYLDDHVIDCLSESSQVKIQEQKTLLDLSNQPLGKYMPKVLQMLERFLDGRLKMMKPDNRTSMVTVKYTLNGIDILRNFEVWIEKAMELEHYFREVQTLELNQLFERVFDELNEKKIDFSLDLGEVSAEGIPLMENKEN